MDSRFQASAGGRAAWDVPALAVGISVGGAVETSAVGCDPTTRFRVASITKPFTAALALELLDLEARPGSGPRTSGSATCSRTRAATTASCPSVTRPVSATATTRSRRTVAELPVGAAIRSGVEQAWSYANTGYWLAGRAVRSSGRIRPTKRRCERRILRPAGLESTSFGEPEVAGTGRDALDVPYPAPAGRPAASSPNVADLLRFGAWHLGQPDAARMRVVHGKPTAGVYGLGLFGERVGGVEVWGHSGSYGGFQSSLLLVPDREAVFVGLTNGSLGAKALYDLEDCVLRGRRRRGAARADPVDLPRAVLDSYAGSYANSDGSHEVALCPAASSSPSTATSTPHARSASARSR